MKHKESLISANHNYMVNNMLSSGFLLGDPGSDSGFWFLADVVPAQENTPRVSGNLFDERGEFLVEIRKGHVVRNPGGCVLQIFQGGMRLQYPSGETLLNIHTQIFTNGYLTRIQGKLFDEKGRLRAEPSRDGIKVYREATLALKQSVLK